MTVGALLDLGVSAEALSRALSALPMADEFRTEIRKTEKNGVLATKFDVIVEKPSPHHRSFADIRRMLGESRLPEGVKEKSAAVFETLAEAEGAVHGRPKDAVHFHEVGATDSIVDIVGAAFCLEELAPALVLTSPVTDGSGFIECAHGKIPVPVPAVLKLFEGADLSLRLCEEKTEMVTPTGAAILRAFAKSAAFMPNMRILKVGYGAGTKSFQSRPNVLRALLGETEGEPHEEKIVVVETNIDDMPGEAFSYLMERLFALGARDVSFAPVYMKKNRPATKVEILCDESLLDAVCETVFAESAAIGLRYSLVNRRVLPREMRKIQTSFGEASIKETVFGNNRKKAKPEYEDVRRIALQTGRPFLEIQREILSEVDYGE
jgi:uncharacterized protein (TIGR00299 family) protein